MKKQKWEFGIYWGWDIDKNFVDINLLSFHMEEHNIWVEIVGVVLQWEKN